MPGAVTAPERGIDQLTDQQLERLAQVDRGEVRAELRRRERQQHEREKEAERRREQQARRRAAEQAVRQLSDDRLEGLVDRPGQREPHGETPVYYARTRLPDTGAAEKVSVGDFREAARREREKRERHGSPEQRRARRAAQARRQRAREAQQPATVTIAGREIPAVALGIVLVLAAVTL